MTTVRELLDVTRRALATYVQTAALERMAGTQAELADIRAHRVAMRQTVEELCKLLECDPCDL